MSCIEDTTLLERYADDELPAVMRRRVEAALESCEHCQDELAQLYAVREALVEHMAMAVDAAPLDSLWDRIEDQLGPTEVPQQPSFAERLRAWWNSQRLELAFGAAIAACAAVLLVWVAGSLPERGAAQPELVEATGGNNQLVVESYEVKEGTVVIDVDPDDPTAPAVVWHFVDDEDAG